MIEQQTIEQQTKATNSNYIRVPYACEVLRHVLSAATGTYNMISCVPSSSRIGVENLHSKTIDWRLNDIVKLRTTLVFEGISQAANTSLGMVVILLGIPGTSPLQQEQLSRFDIMTSDVFAGNKLSRPVVVYETFCKKVVDTNSTIHAFKVQGMNFQQTHVGMTPTDEFRRNAQISIQLRRSGASSPAKTIIQKTEAFYVGNAQENGELIYDM